MAPDLQRASAAGCSIVVLPEKLATEEQSPKRRQFDADSGTPEASMIALVQDAGSDSDEDGGANFVRSLPLLSRSGDAHLPTLLTSPIRGQADFSTLLISPLREGSSPSPLKLELSPCPLSPAKEPQASEAESEVALNAMPQKMVVMESTQNLGQLSGGKLRHASILSSARPSTMEPIHEEHDTTLPRRPVPTRPSSLPSSSKSRRWRRSQMAQDGRRRQASCDSSASASRCDSVDVLVAPGSEHKAGGPGRPLSSMPVAASLKRGAAVAGPLDPATLAMGLTKAANMADVYHSLCSTRHGGMSARIFTRLCLDCYQLCKTCEFTIAKFTAAAAKYIFEMIALPDEQFINVQQFEDGLSHLSMKIKVADSILRLAIASVVSPGLRTMAAKQDDGVASTAVSSPLCPSPSLPRSAPWSMKPSFAPSHIVSHTRPSTGNVDPQTPPSTLKASGDAHIQPIAETTVTAAANKVARGPSSVPPFLKSSCVPSSTDCQSDSPSSTWQHPSRSNACRPPSPSTPPTSCSRRPRPRPRPLGSLALLEAAGATTSYESGGERSKSSQLSHVQGDARAHGQAQSPTASPSYESSCGMPGVMSQQPKTLVSPFQGSDASTATPMGSSQFGSPPPSSLPSPQHDGTVATPMGGRKSAIQSPSMESSPSRLCSMPAVVPHPVETLISPSQESEASTCTPTGLLQFDSPEPSPEAVAEPRLPGGRFNGAQRCAATGGRTFTRLLQSTGNAIAKDAKESATSPLRRKSHSVPAILCQQDHARTPPYCQIDATSSIPKGSSPLKYPQPSAGAKRSSSGLGPQFSELLQTTCNAVAESRLETPPDPEMGHSQCEETTPSPMESPQEETRPATCAAAVKSSPTTERLVRRSTTQPSLVRPASAKPTVRRLFRRTSLSMQSMNDSAAMLDEPERQVARNFDAMDAFSAFSSGDRGMSCKGFAKLCHHSGIAAEASPLIFNQVIPKGRRHMNFVQFEMAIARLAEIQHVKEDVLWQSIEGAGAAQQTPLPTNCPSPKVEQKALDPSKNSMHFAPMLRPLCSLSRTPSNTKWLTSPTSQPLSSRSSSLPAFAVQRSPAPPSVFFLTPADALTALCLSMPLEDSAEVTGALSPAFPAGAPQETPEHQRCCAMEHVEAEARLQKLCKVGREGAPCKSRGDTTAEARDALDAAVLFGAEATRKGVPDEQRLHAKRRASDALSLALLAEARDSGIDVVPNGLLKAKQVAQGALDFTLLTERNLDIDMCALDELKVHAQDAVQVGLLAMQRAEITSEEPLSPRLQASAPEALEQLLGISSRVFQGHLCGQSLVDARQSAREAVTRAVTCEAKCSGIQVAPEELEQALQQAYLALDSVTLAEPDMCASGESSPLQRRALHALHLALLGVKMSC